MHPNHNVKLFKGQWLSLTSFLSSLQVCYLWLLLEYEAKVISFQVPAHYSCKARTNFQLLGTWPECLGTFSRQLRQQYMNEEEFHISHDSLVKKSEALSFYLRHTRI